MTKEEHIEDAILYLGDCNDILSKITGIDAVLTDPPYGIGFAAQPTKWSRDNINRKREAWDNKPPDMAKVLALNVPTMVWGGELLQSPTFTRVAGMDKASWATYIWDYGIVLD
jgi:site-specific DNA-methyltransferase (adenine-specific)/modification methylase